MKKRYGAGAVIIGICIAGGLLTAATGRYVSSAESEETAAVSASFPTAPQYPIRAELHERTEKEDEAASYEPGGGTSYELAGAAGIPESAAASEIAAAGAADFEMLPETDPAAVPEEDLTAVPAAVSEENSPGALTEEKTLSAAPSESGKAADGIAADSVPDSAADGTPRAVVEAAEETLMRLLESEEAGENEVPEGFREEELRIWTETLAAVDDACMAQMSEEEAESFRAEAAQFAEGAKSREAEKASESGTVSEAARLRKRCYELLERYRLP